MTIDTYQQANLSLSCQTMSAAFSRDAWKSRMQTFWVLSCLLMQSPCFRYESRNFECGLHNSRTVSKPPSATRSTSCAWVSVMQRRVKFERHVSVSVSSLHCRLISLLVTAFWLLLWVKTAIEARHKSSSRM